MSNPTRDNIQRFNIKYPVRVTLISLKYTGTILGILSNVGDEWHLLYIGKNAVVLIHKTLLSSINQALLRSINLDPLKFSNIKNPDTLFSICCLYGFFGSKYIEIIENIYKQNIGNFYIFKNNPLRSMEMLLNLKNC
jgi:hypothetical protein